MKKIVIVAAILIIVLLLALFMPYEWRFWYDKAPALPEINEEEIVFLQAFVYESNYITVTNSDRAKILEHLKNAEPTRIPSYTDSVYAEDYRGINIKTEQTSYRFFVYKSGRKTLLEIPYHGVYEVDAELFLILDSYFN